MRKLTRREMFKFASLGGAALATGALGSAPALAGEIKLAKGGKDFSPKTGKERKRIPSACWQCVTRDAIVGYVEDGRLMKLEGHPESIRTQGKLCAKGQAGINQVYFPDRILYPLKRVGKRGEHKWKRISWDEAVNEVAGKLKPLLDAGTPEKFMYHYGRHKGSQSKTAKDFLAAFGTSTIQGHTSICEGGKWVSQELTWGHHYDNWDFEKTDFILMFGSNLANTHTNHIPLMPRMMDAHVDRGVPMYVFDVRLTSTAAVADKWIPIGVGKDSVVALAMCNVIMNEGLYKKDLFKFMKVSADRKASDADKVKALKAQLAKYTPEYAEKESMVPADTIRDLARRFAKAKAAVVATYRGAVAHWHGADTERAINLLAAITGNINNPGGRCQAVGPKWHGPKSKHGKTKGMHVKNGFKGDAAFPNHHICQKTFPVIKDGHAGRPDVYMWSCYNPAYVNGDMEGNRALMKDEKLMPYLVSINIVYDESSSLADIIIPDVTYPERWDWDDMASATQVPEFYIRQPLVKPLGEAKDQADFFAMLAKKLGIELAWKDKEDYVRQSCEKTPEIKAVGGFEYMKEHGVWHDKNAKPVYHQQEKLVKAGDLKKDGVIFDEDTGVYWNWHKSGAKSEAEAKKVGYQNTKHAYKGYVGQEINGKVYKGFKPDKVNKSGMLEFYSELLKSKDLPAFPMYAPIPTHAAKAKDELILTTYKVAVHTHSRTAHCKWLSEIYHDNPGLMNPVTAKERGLKDGDKIKVKSDVGEIETHVSITEGIVPGVIAISYHVGREHSGRYGSGNADPIPGIVSLDDDPDFKNMNWDKHGVHPNTVIPNGSDPISGQQPWMDTVVRVERA